MLAWRRVEDARNPAPGGGPPAPDPLDVDALMEDLRRRVAEKKAQGLYGVDALMEASVEEGAEPFGLDDLERLRELAVQRVDLRVAASTKPVVGGALSRLKRLLVRGTSQPVYGLSAQATAFNAALLGYLSSLAREVGALERQVQAEREAAGAAQERLGRLEEELRSALSDVAEARAEVARMADAALPERVARLERAPAPPARGAAGPGAAGGGAMRLRLEATEDDPGRRGRLEAYGRALSAAGSRILHVGAGSGRGLPLLGEDAEGVEPDGELAAAAAADERPVRHADPVAFLAASPAGSVDGILVTDLVERLDGDDLVALAGAIEHALAPGGVAIVEGLDPAALGDEGAFWRDPGRRRPVHPDAVRMALESAGLGSTAVEEHGAADGGEGSAPRRYAVHAAR
jgi:hypothetical protein